MKFRTLNSEYELKDQQLFRNGELYTPNVMQVGSVSTDWIFHNRLPSVGEMLYVEYLNGEDRRCIRTSIVQEVCD